ncbi:uncharacterized protein DMENIID0001_060990 [Sergentomyia squamirostris]
MSVASVPHSLLGNMKEMDFMTKLKTFIYSAFGKITSNLLNEKSEKYYKSIFPYPKYRPYDEMKRNISLFLINEHVTVDTARALVPNVIPVGGLNIKSKPDQLPQDIQDFMDHAKDGVVYISFGTTPECANITETYDILRIFSKLKQRVLFKRGGKIKLDTPENVMIKKWFPQQDILAHKNVQVFITHGGIKGITEARYHAVPIIGLPIFGDQFTNVDTAVKEGWGLHLRLKDLNEESLSIALSEILNNPKYKEAARKMSTLYRDRPNSAMDTAIYWTEYVIRHHGAPHLQSPAAHLNLWQRNSLDVIAFLAFLFFRSIFPYPKYRPYDEMRKNISLFLINEHVSVDTARALVPNVIPVGGLNIKSKPDPLPQDIQNFMDNAKDGVAYVSFGTSRICENIKAIDYILRTFTKVTQRVLIKWNGDVQLDTTGNIMMKKWFPQQDILAHKNVRVFITHGGLNSITEARYHAVPVIGIPICADQFTNVDTAVKEGWGLLLQLKDLNEESLSIALSEVLNNPKYKDAAQKMSTLYRDRPNSAMDTAIYWTEYVIRHQGAPHLQSPAVHLNFWQRNSLDVIAFLATILVVTVMSQCSFNQPTENYREIKLDRPNFSRYWNHPMVKELETQLLGQNKHFSIMEYVRKLSLQYFNDSVFKLFNHSFYQPPWQKIMQEESFDLVFIEICYNHIFVGLGDHFKCPVIGFFSGIQDDHINELSGNPMSVASVPHSLLGNMKEMDFITKLKTVLYSAFGKISSYLLNARSEEYYKSIFPYPKYRPYNEMIKNISLFLINEHVSVDTARALIPNVIPVGGLNIKSKPDPLPQDIQNFMDSAEDGVAYVSFGTSKRCVNITETYDIRRTFSNFKQRALLKWDHEIKLDTPGNIMIKNWFPQQDILAHKNARVFITHGGIKAITEARYHAVPIIGVPIFGDQFTNVDMAVKEGWGLLLRLKDLNEESLSIALSEVLNNPKYKDAAQKMSTLYRDRPNSAMDTAIYWTEYVIRHHGAPHLQSPAAHLNFWQRNSLDVIAFLGVILMVTVMSHSSFSEPTANYREIKLDSPSIDHKTFEKHHSFHQPQLQKIMQEETFDLVFIEIFLFDYLVGLGDHFKCPVIGFYSGLIDDKINDLSGNPMSVASVPHSLLGNMKKMDFITKLKTFLQSVIVKIISDVLTAISESCYKSNFPYPKYRPYYEMRKNISLFFINEHVSVDTARALVPNVIPVGGLNIKSKPDQLPQDIQIFMDNAKDGVVYVSFGTTHTCANITKTDYILRTLTKLKQRVLIKWGSDVQLDTPENIMIKNWFPQQDILAHKNLRVFITHGGIKGITEARYHAVPIIGVPIFADQFTNVDTAVKEGWGLLLRLKDLNEESLLIALSEVLNNPKYKEAALKMSSLYRDRPKSAMDTAIYWTEYVIRHHGAPHLQSPAVHLNFWEQNSLDVIAFLAVILVVIIKLSIFFLKYCCNKMILKLFAVNNKSKEE